MVVRLKSGKSIRGALSYNEQKVSAGKAELILASRFGCELDQLGFTRKLERFEMLNKESQWVNTNTLHLSLNFSPYDRLDTQKMQDIAADYMRRIGFGDQPFLVYRHDDANHPHIHIVSSIIRPNGKAINIHNLHTRKSEPARKAIEADFNLIPAESMKRTVTLPMIPASLERAVYGQAETKRVISNIVLEVIRSYHFVSLEEFNAILKNYNVIADTGREGSRIRATRGLTYSILDDNGSKTGIPIKASSIYSKPTLAALEKKFAKEAPRKQLYTKRAITDLQAFFNRPGKITEDAIIQRLAKRKLNVTFIRDASGNPQSLLVVDHFNKVVLDGKDLNISITALQNKIAPNRDAQTIKRAKISQKANQDQKHQTLEIPQTTLKLLADLLSNKHADSGPSPNQFKKKKKKRKYGL